MSNQITLVLDKYLRNITKKDLTSLVNCTCNYDLVKVTYTDGTIYLCLVKDDGILVTALRIANEAKYCAIITVSDVNGKFSYNWEDALARVEKYIEDDDCCIETRYLDINDWFKLLKMGYLPGNCEV